MAALLAWGHCGGAQAAEELARVNEALRGWLQLMEKDRPYLVLDGSARQLRLQHGSAVLRQCPVVSDSVETDAPLRQWLTARLRRHRRADPFTPIEAGPFDWEHYLVTEAPGEAALLFSKGILLYAAEVWRPVRPPSVRLRSEDLRALYDAVADSVDLVLLPAGWELER